jgi:hypothetical protein
MSLTELQHSALEKARKYQRDLLRTFPKRGDAILQTIEALAAAESPTSVVELTQEGAFQRSFSSIHKAIDALSAFEEPINHGSQEIPSVNQQASLSGYEGDKQKWMEIFSELLPKQDALPFLLFALDATSESKVHAETMKDRMFVHKKNMTGAPVMIGLQASVLVAIPEAVNDEPKWTLPISVARISSQETPCEVAYKQLKELGCVARFREYLCVIVTDCGYSNLTAATEQQVVIARSRSDRVGHRPFNGQGQNAGRGRPRKYAEESIVFREDSEVGDKKGPDEQIEGEILHNKKPVFMLTSRWRNVYLQGREDLVDVVKVELFSKENGSPLFETPLLLIVSGQRRAELSGEQIFKCYLRRFDIEHFFRFQKQKLLFCSYQTADLRRQVNWWWICLMAYWLLYMVREAAPESNRQWMPKRRGKVASPGEAKRVFGAKIFPDLSSPSKKPRTRGKSIGRRMGTRFEKRERQKVVKKTEKMPKAA